MREKEKRFHNDECSRQLASKSLQNKNTRKFEASERQRFSVWYEPDRNWIDDWWQKSKQSRKYKAHTQTLIRHGPVFADLSHKRTEERSTIIPRGRPHFRIWFVSQYNADITRRRLSLQQQERKKASFHHHKVHWWTKPTWRENEAFWFSLKRHATGEKNNRHPHLTEAQTSNLLLKRTVQKALLQPSGLLVIPAGSPTKKSSETFKRVHVGEKRDKTRQTSIGRRRMCFLTASVRITVELRIIQQKQQGLLHRVVTKRQLSANETKDKIIFLSNSSIREWRETKLPETETRTCENSVSKSSSWTRHCGHLLSWARTPLKEKNMKKSSRATWR